MGQRINQEDILGFLADKSSSSSLKILERESEKIKVDREQINAYHLVMDILDKWEFTVSCRDDINITDFLNDLATVREYVKARKGVD